MQKILIKCDLVNGDSVVQSFNISLGGEEITPVNVTRIGQSLMPFATHLGMANKRIERISLANSKEPEDWFTVYGESPPKKEREKAIATA